MSEGQFRGRQGQSLADPINADQDGAKESCYDLRPFSSTNFYLQSSLMTVTVVRTCSLPISSAHPYYLTPLLSICERTASALVRLEHLYYGGIILVGSIPYRSTTHKKNSNWKFDGDAESEVPLRYQPPLPWKTINSRTIFPNDGDSRSVSKRGG